MTAVAVDLALESPVEGKLNENPVLDDSDAAEDFSPSPPRLNEKPDPKDGKVVDALDPNTDVVGFAAGAVVEAPKTGAVEVPKTDVAAGFGANENPFDDPSPAPSNSAKFGVPAGALIVTTGESVVFSATLNVKLADSVLFSSGFLGATLAGEVLLASGIEKVAETATVAGGTDGFVSCGFGSLGVGATGVGAGSSFFLSAAATSDVDESPNGCWPDEPRLKPKEGVADVVEGPPNPNDGGFEGSVVDPKPVNAGFDASGTPKPTKVGFTGSSGFFVAAKLRGACET